MWVDKKGNITTNYSTNPDVLKDMSPVYLTFDGNFDAVSIKDYDKLPDRAKIYIKAIEDFIKVPISIIGTGADREDMIIRG